MNAFRISIIVLGWAALVANAHPYGSELAQLDLEELMAMNITTVTKREQSLRKTPAAIHVITQDDIRRSGAVTVAEVLELAPGIQADRSSRAFWSIASRGMRTQYSDKLLVMVDGRSVYNPLIGGVNWEIVLPSLNEIERIEIIRGPGTSIWGANAINGVINIITYDSELTTDTRATVAAGNEERVFARVRQGGRSGNITGRFNIDYRKADAGFDPELNTAADDPFNTVQISSRLDWKPRPTDATSWDFGYTRASLHGEADLDQVIERLSVTRQDFGSEKAWLMNTWLHQLNVQDSIQIKAYLDWEDRVEPTYGYQQNTFDLDLQYNLAPRGNHLWTIGAASRKIHSETEGTFIASFSDDTLSYTRYTGFIQDEIRITDATTVTLGAKYEDNRYVDPELQPSLRVGYTMTDTALLWAAMSRAAKTPGRIDGVIIHRSGVAEEVEALVNAISDGLGESTYVETIGNKSYESEIADIFELGTRAFFADTLFVDLSIYHARYERLRNNEFLEFAADPLNTGFHKIVVSFENNGDGEAKGAELFVQFQPYDTWRLKAAYAYTALKSSDNETPGRDYYVSVFSFTSKDSAYLISQHEIGNDWEFDMKLKFTGKKHFQMVDSQKLHGYYDLSARLGRRLNSNLYLSLIASKLLDDRQVEWENTFDGYPVTEIERSVFLQLDWK